MEGSKSRSTVGNGRLLWIGFDAILGCGNNIYLLDNLINLLHEMSFYTLNQITNRNYIELWNQGLISTIVLGLEGDYVVRWYTYAGELRRILL